MVNFVPKNYKNVQMKKPIDIKMFTADTKSFT